jgi:hypothetical protein
MASKTQKPQIVPPTPAPMPGATPSATPSPSAGAQPSNQSAFQKYLSGLQDSGGMNPYAIPTRTTTEYLTQTSQPDIESLVNGVMQQLVGRFATPEEIQKYGAELLAAEKANPGMYSGETTYQQSGKRATVSGTQLTTGVQAQDFLTNLIQGTADAKQYRVASQFLDAMQKANSQFRGAYSG